MTPQRYKTLRHMETVRNYLNVCIRELLTRGEQHDQSKLEPPEVEAYDVITDLLRGLTYGSPEYRAVLKAQQPAIQHHYQTYRHHPEHFANGVDGMTLIDLLEMVCDWKAATLRHADGDLYQSLTINQQRFGLAPQTVQILHNTVDWLQAQDVWHKAHES
jgi:hypothetical protein